MSYTLYDDEKRLQRKLIPLNIVVAIIALVAAISLIITPLLKINVSKLAGEMVKSLGGESGDGSSAEEDESAQYVIIFESIDADIELSPLHMFKVLTAPADEKGTILINSLFIENGLFEQIALSMVNVTLAVATEAIENVEELRDLDLPALNDALYKIDNAKSSDDVAKELDDYLALLEQQLDFKFTEDMKTAARDNCTELYDKTVEATGGSFSVEKMICVNLSPEGGEVYMNYSDLMTGMLSGDSASSEGSGDTMAQMIDMLNQIAVPYGYLFIYVAFNALIWFILFLFAFFRTFAKNKRFTMWYVKLIGCWPCIIFFLLPFAMSKAAASVAELASLAGIFTAISSMTWISGICYLLLWLFSICWAFPIKHKIRKLRKGR